MIIIYILQDLNLSGDQKGGKVFLHIKQEIQALERRKTKASRDRTEVGGCFVDRSRQAGVLMGTKDLKTDVRQREMQNR